MSSITIKHELPAELLSNILITAFDGAYGSSWNWFEPTPSPDKFWLKTNGDIEKMAASDTLWLEAKVRLRRDNDGEYLTDNPVFDNPEGFVIDHDAIANGISRIINDDYVGIWRKARPDEVEAWKARGNSGIGQQRTRLVAGEGLMVETGETARGWQEYLAKQMLAPEDADIDADLADCIVQCAAFGKVIFG